MYNKCDTANIKIYNRQYNSLSSYISEETSITTVLTSHATNLQETTLITTVSKERVSEASMVCGK